MVTLFGPLTLSLPTAQIVSSSVSRSWKGELEELGYGSLVREDGFTLVDEVNQAYSFFHPEWTVKPVL